MLNSRRGILQTNADRKADVGVVAEALSAAFEVDSVVGGGTEYEVADDGVLGAATCSRNADELV
jgi:hypothetical protein